MSERTSGFVCQKQKRTAMVTDAVFYFVIVKKGILDSVDTD